MLFFQVAILSRCSRPTDAIVSYQLFINNMSLCILINKKLAKFWCCVFATSAECDINRMLRFRNFDGLLCKNCGTWHAVSAYPNVDQTAKCTLDWEWWIENSYLFKYLDWQPYYQTGHHRPAVIRSILRLKGLRSGTMNTAYQWHKISSIYGNFNRQ